MKKVFISILLILCIFLVGCDDIYDALEEAMNSITVFTEPAESQTIDDVIEITSNNDIPTIESEIISFVNAFNSSSNVSLVFVEDFTPSDKSSLHYRTEFRLSAYSDAIGKSYTLGETVVDIVGKQSWSGSITIRVYMDGATLDQCVEMVKYASPIMDSDIDSNELQTTIDYITENKTANGYYYADLGLLLLGNDSKGYEFMLKMGND